VSLGSQGPSQCNVEHSRVAKAGTFGRKHPTFLVYLPVLICAAPVCACMNAYVAAQGRGGKLAGMKRNSGSEGCGRREWLKGEGKQAGCFQQQCWLMPG